MKLPTQIKTKTNFLKLANYPTISHLNYKLKNMKIITIFMPSRILKMLVFEKLCNNEWNHFTFLEKFHCDILTDNIKKLPS